MHRSGRFDPVRPALHLRIERTFASDPRAPSTQLRPDFATTTTGICIDNERPRVSSSMSDMLVMKAPVASFTIEPDFRVLLVSDLPLPQRHP